jgi:hypothetical protein
MIEAVPLSNVRVSKVQVVNRLGWLVQIQSLCASSRSPIMPCIRLLVNTHLCGEAVNFLENIAVVSDRHI